MIKIADNPAVREQVKAAPADAGLRQQSNLADALAPAVSGYPATALVLDNGRYYADATKK